ncbi:capsule biosynthesis protein [Streptococcus criceti]|uniref:CapA domain protein n=1 Tax=Streptococcus criceti HS-6 TaxID=873449 RepID=G5JPX3_STRCG|nr:CapA family protein [Streptococcus criceti]EHI74906.1 CapA domain protein [Streptococcus criceti HS-6]SUN43183.1 capsule biosynthesis protein [Streptococcus criceti]
MKKLPLSRVSLICVTLVLAILVVAAFYDASGLAAKKSETKSGQVQTARVVANGDILIHDILYMSARQSDGSYDFNPYFKYAKNWISDADLALGDYEGTISSDYPLAGYPLFNAPSSIATTLKETGYDVIDLAHNHILDSGLSGALETAQTFNKLGLDTIGIYQRNRRKETFLIKKVNGIKIAILGYSYGYNGMESNLSKSEYKKHLSDLNEKQMKAELAQAEKQADITVVMPQMGVEYQKDPTNEQVQLYHKMIDWGADVIFGGHPHVVEPAETLHKDGQKKFIIYSIGNFISNQNQETVDDIWTERGLLMDVTFEKAGQKTVIKTVKAHPTMVWRQPTGQTVDEGYDAYNYQTLVLEDFIKGGKYRHKLDSAMKEKIDTAYKEMKELVNLKW